MDFGCVVPVDLSHSSQAYPVVCDEKMRGHLRHLAQIVMALFESQTGEPQGRLTAASVLLWKIYRELVQDLSSVSAQRSVSMWGFLCVYIGAYFKKRE
jgi:hypothetical protein